MDNCKIHAILYFDTEINLGISNTPLKFFNYDTKIFNNGTEALYEFMQDDNPYRILLSAYTEEDMAYMSAEAIENFQNEEWVTNFINNLPN